MRKLSIRKSIIYAVLLSFVAVATAYADGAPTYEVTITNLTRKQVIPPPVVITHKNSFQLFYPGGAAIPELATLAEEGDPGQLLGYLDTQPDVYDFAAADGPVLPGKSVTLKVGARHRARFLTAVGMLATTNDAFFGVRNVRLPFYGMTRTTAVAYDAGSEANSELCEFIPGPPCGNHVHDDSEAEGFIHVHSGIRDVGDLNPANMDWRNPVVEIKVRRLY